MRALARHWQGVSDLWHGWWREFLDLKVNASSLPAAVLLVAAATPGWALRLRERHLDAIYFLLDLAMIALWPFPEHTARFHYPEVALLLYFVLVSISRLHDSAWRRGAHALVLGTTLLAVMPSSGQILVKALSDQPVTLGSYAQTRVLYASESPLISIERNAFILRELAAAMRESGAQVPPGECVYATHFEMYTFYARRHARPIVPQDIDNKVQFNAPACRYMLVNFSNSHPVFRPGYPLPGAQLNSAVVYEHRAPAANGAVGPLIAQLLLLMTPAEFDEAKKAGAVQ